MFSYELSDQLNMPFSILEFEKKLIVDALKSCDGNIKDAGVVIGVKRTTLLEKMKRMNIIFWKLIPFRE